MIRKTALALLAATLVAATAHSSSSPPTGTVRVALFDNPRCIGPVEDGTQNECPPTRGIAARVRIVPIEPVGDRQAVTVRTRRAGLGRTVLATGEWEVRPRRRRGDIVAPDPRRFAVQEQQTTDVIVEYRGDRGPR